MWNTILFDLDGTLTDSGEGIIKSVQYALKKGFAIDVENPEVLRCFVGPPLKEQFMSFANLTEEEGERAVEIYRERYIPTGIYENRVYPGIPELLEALKKENFTMAVASSKPENMCKEVLRHFGLLDYFTVVVGSELDGRRTGKSEVIEETLRRLGMSDERDEVVLIGDTRFDAEGAKRAGIGSVMVSYGYGSREDLEAAWPDCIVDNAEELGNVLIGQARAETMRLEGAPAAPVAAEPSGGFGSVLFKIWRIAYPILTHYGITIGLSLAFLFVLMGYTAVMGGSMEGATDAYLRQTVLLTGVADAAALPLLFFFMSRDEKERRKAGRTDRMLTKKKFNVKDVILVGLLVLCVSWVLNLAVSFLPIDDSSFEEGAEAIMSAGLLLQIIVVGLLGPVVEEVLFRGLVFRRLRDYIPLIPAVVLSGICFGIYHGNLTQGIFTSILGILLAVLYEKYGSLWMPITGHIVNNMYATLANEYMAELDIPLPALIVSVAAAVVIGGTCAYLIFFRKSPSDHA